MSQPSVEIEAPSGVEEPGIGWTAATAWRAAFATVARFPLLFLLPAAVSAATEFLRLHLLLAGQIGAAGNGAFQLASSLLLAILLAPLAIATHRRVLLGEGGATGSGERPRILRFIRYALVWTIVLSLPGLVWIAANAMGVGGLGIIAIFWYIPIVIFCVKTAILFPAVAVDAPAVGWRNAGGDSSGHGFRILAIFVLCSLPALLWVLVGVIAYSGSPGPSTGGRIVLHAVDAALATFTAATCAAAASTLYAAYAHRLLGLEPPPDETVAQSPDTAAPPERQRT